MTNCLYTDFLFEKEDGCSPVIEEVKGNNWIDESVDQAMKEAAE